MHHRKLINHYEDCFIKHGDSHLGVDWPNLDDVNTRYQIMLDGINLVNAKSCLDFGSGLAHFREYLQDKGQTSLLYEGIELSTKMLLHCKLKMPEVVFHSHDVLVEGWKMKQFDAVVMNGVFTEKQSLNYTTMFAYFEDLLKLAYHETRKIVIFNVMSKQVDWERDDLFHVPLDELAWMLSRNFGRSYIIRSDYGLYEYTVYLKK